MPVSHVKNLGTGKLLMTLRIKCMDCRVIWLKMESVRTHLF